MAFLEFKNVRIAGFAAGVPSFIASNLHPLEDDGTVALTTDENLVISDLVTVDDPKEESKWV